MRKITTNRNIDLIAAEINNIKDQTAFGIKAKEKAEKEKEKFKNLANEKSEEAKKMFEDKMKSESDRLLSDKVLQEIQKDLDSSAEKIDELEAQLKAKQIDVITAEPVVVEKIPAEIEIELEALRKKASLIDDQSIIRFEIYCEQLQKTFTSQLELVEGIKNTNPETYDKCKNAILSLVNKIAEGL